MAGRKAIAARAAAAEIAQEAAVEEGYGRSRFNAAKHGVLSRYTVLPWEDTAEYTTLLARFVEEHDPQGPTEEHLVEELAGIVWRKRRLRLAEAADLRAGFRQTTRASRQWLLAQLDGDSPASSAAITSALASAGVAEGDSDPELAGIVHGSARELEERRRLLEAALASLEAARAAHASGEPLEALSALLDAESAESWQDYRDDYEIDDEYTEDDAFDEWAGGRVTEIGQALARIVHADQIRQQAWGAALRPERLDQIARYEVHLDRKFERTLAMLLKLKSMRGADADRERPARPA